MLHRLQGMTTEGYSVLAARWLRQFSRITLSARQGFALIVLALSALLLASPALAQFTQQGPKLVGTGASFGPVLQSRVSLSADGNTAIVGGYYDNGRVGAAWVWTRSAGVWSQQGGKLVGTGAVGTASQGQSIAISADGNTAIVGGAGDNNGTGAAWVFTRNAGVWSQQGSKLVGTGAVGAASQGQSVSISADGNTAIVGGWGDNNAAGAAWVFTRNAGVWSQQGTKLVGAASGVNQGISVSLSADGSTAIIGGTPTRIWTRYAGVWSQQGAELVGSGAIGAGGGASSVSLAGDGDTAIVGSKGDNGQVGAAWIFTRNAGVWNQQGSKLVGTGAVGAALQGSSVSISADGNKAIVGGNIDNSFAGASWVWIRSGGVWSQQGSKLVGTGAVGAAWQGSSVSLSSDGNTAIVGGIGDNNDVGAAWVFVSPPAPLTVTTISPNSGPIKGGTRVTVTGTGFVNGATVTIDGVPATSVTWVSSTSITAITPASNAGGAAGAKNVVVTNPDALSGTLLNGFSYGNFFRWISGISPNSGPLTGGTLVTITGVGFSSGAAVTIDGTPATSVVRVNATTILANTPPANGMVAGAKNVVVTNNDNSTISLPGGFTYRSTPVNGHCGGIGIPCLPATPPLPGVRDLPTVLDLNAGDGPGMTSCLMDTLGRNLPGTLNYQKQTATGISTIAWNNQWIAFYPVANDTTINAGAPLHQNPANTFDIATRCGTLVVAPAVFNLGELGAVFNTMGLFAQINQDGMIVVQSHGTTYVVQPDFVVTPGAPGTPRLEAAQDGAYRFMDSGGSSQLLRLVSVAP